MFGFTHSEQKIVQHLNTPGKIQDYLDTLSMNFEPNGDTLMSPRRVLREQKAHCLEGALFAASVLWLHGHSPLLLDIQSARNDFDHVVALFRVDNCWGAISKTNHAVLRYREPVYRSYHELAMSYFHEYFLDDGTKTMQTYSKPFNVKRFGDAWMTSEDDLWYIGEALDESPHIQIATSAMRKNFRKASSVEIRAGKIVEWE